MALTGLLDTGLDAGACVAGLISTGLATAWPVIEDDTRAAERLWSIVPAAAAVLCSRLLAEPADLGRDRSAALIDAALVQCGSNLDAVLDGAGDPSAQVGQFGPDAERMAVLSAEQVEAVWQAAAVVPQTLLDADTRAVAARQMFDARRTPELARAAREATSIVRSAERLVACLPVPELRSRRSRPGATPMGKADGSRCPPCPRRWRWWRASRRAITRPAGPSSAAGGIAGPTSPGRRPT